MIKNIIFDYGNTIVEFEPKNIIKRFGVDKDEDIKILEKTAFDRKYWDRFDDGTLSAEDFKEKISEILPERLIKVSGEIADNWMLKLPYICGMDTLIKRLKSEGYRLYLLSNISREFAKRKDKTEIFELFDGLVFSGEIGIVKPQKEIFEYLLNKYKLAAEECLLVDDNNKNVESAKKLNIQSLLFSGNYKEVEEFLLGNSLK